MGKKEYISYAQDHLSIWCQSWYLDAVCGDEWDCRFIVKADKIIAVWVFGLRVKWGLKSINFPTFLKYNGIFFWGGVKNEEKDAIGMKLLAELPKSVKMSVEFMPGIEGEVPSVIKALEDRAFAQKERTTYRWELGKGKEVLLKAMDGNYRRMIKKQGKAFELRSETREEAMEMYDFHTKWVGDLRDHGVTREEYARVIDAFYEHESGEVVSLYKEGVKIASVLLMRDDKTVYYLLAVNNKDYNKIYPSVLMSDKISSYVSERGVKRIDFLGSDIESISRVWRKLGAEKYSYIFMNKNFQLPF